MAEVYPELFVSFNQFTDPQIIQLHRILTDYVSQLNLSLQQRDDQVDSTPADRVLPVNDTTAVQNPQEGDVRYDRATSKYQGYVPATGWVDFH
jgi:hypothetical protein